MKHITTLSLILLTLTANCQNDTLFVGHDTISYNPNVPGKMHNHRQNVWSINSGVNYSHFTNDHGYGKFSLGYAGGVSVMIPTNSNWFFQPSISYEKKGSRNENEQWRFNTYSIVLEPFVGYRAGCISLMAAPYYDRVIMGANKRIDGDGFSWYGGDCHFWEANQFGFTLATEIDLTNASLHFEYSLGVSQVRHDLNDWTGHANYTLWGSRNEVISTRLVLPLKTFK